MHKLKNYIMIQSTVNNYKNVLIITQDTKYFVYVSFSDANNHSFIQSCWEFWIPFL